MTAARPYRMTPLTTEQALTELRKFGGVQFDPDVVEAFFKTKWARVGSDAESDEVRDVPLIGHKAGALTGRGRNPGAA
jgi:HD-GYP domain-containing protein (c-di-GMP phosphodiesterase class II)